MKFRIIAVAALCLFSAVSASAADKKEETWSDVSPEIQEVKIKSSLDGTMQPSIFYKAKQKGRPLIVSLHAWSADYRHVYRGRFEYAMEHDYNIIHPNFRGPNCTPEAMGSPLTVSDVQDAIEYAIKESGAEPKEVHLVGGSGGGMAVMNCYMRLRYPAKSFTAIAGIYDLIRYYYQAKTRGYVDRYCRMVERAIGTEGCIDEDLLRARSPQCYPYPREWRKGSTLLMLCGIHDGYCSEQPITQTLRMWNKLAEDKYPLDQQLPVSDYEICELLSLRCAPWREKEYIGQSQVYCHRKRLDMEMYIYEAGHGGPLGINECELIPFWK